MRILLVEDDEVLGDGICEGLRLAGHTVDWLLDGDAATLALGENPFDVVILDLALPGRSGLEVLRGWRNDDETVPVLVLTAYGESRDCIDALDSGADDFVGKPADLDEIEARLRAIRRRSLGHADNLMCAGPLCINREQRMAWLDDAPLELSSYEFTVLEMLLERPGRPVTREAIEARLYGWDEGPESNSLQVLIHKLRTKVGGERIQTVRGIGYRLAS